MNRKLLQQFCDFVEAIFLESQLVFRYKSKDLVELIIQFMLSHHAGDDLKCNCRFNIRKICHNSQFCTFEHGLCRSEWVDGESPEALVLLNVVNLTKRAVRNDFSSSPETIVQRSWHCDFGKTKIRKPISLLSASAFCCFAHSLPVGSLNSCAYECWNIWREADSCFVHSACLA